MSETLAINDLWPYLRTLLPPDLDDSARLHGAISRRRGFRSAEDLLRILLAYGVTDLSLQSVAAWARAAELCSLSAPALFYRLRDAERWLAELLAQVLSDTVSVTGRRRLRVVDATVLVGPAAKGTDWRVHVIADPASGRMCRVEITDEHDAESLERQHYEAGEVVLGDRAYATVRGVAAVAERGAFVVARMNPHTIRVCDLSREVLSLRSLEDKVPQVGGVEFKILLPVPPRKRTRSHKPWPLKQAAGWIEARAVAGRTRKGDVIWILTTLPSDDATATEVLALYRLRWQVELLFKRLKSLLGLDGLPTRRGPTARSWILARLLAAALAQKLLAPNEAFSPWGYRL